MKMASEQVGLQQEASEQARLQQEQGHHRRRLSQGGEHAWDMRAQMRWVGISACLLSAAVTVASAALIAIRL
jgi:hypothetical protein